jgi:hypothetical protein
MSYRIVIAERAWSMTRWADIIGVDRSGLSHRMRRHGIHVVTQYIKTKVAAMLKEGYVLPKE